MRFDAATLGKFEGHCLVVPLSKALDRSRAWLSQLDSAGLVAKLPATAVAVTGRKVAVSAV